MQFKQSAEGAFECDVVPDTNHCGIDSSHGNFKFRVSITYTSEKVLDSKGFLLDNLSFSAYFNSLGRLRISCEKVAAEACMYFVETLGPRMAFVSEVSVCIFPFNGVCIEAVQHFNPDAIVVTPTGRVEKAERFL